MFSDESRRSPHCVTWLVGEKGNRKPKFKFFATVADQISFARALSQDVKENGVSAFRLNPDEAREWRAFRARIGSEVLLEDVFVCWERHGAKRPSMTVAAAVERFLDAKEAEGITPLTLGHYRPLFAAFCERFGKRGVASMGRDDITSYLEDVSDSSETKRTVFGRIRSLFNWLVETDRLQKSPCLGVRGPKIMAQPVEILSVDHTKKLFAHPLPAEVKGRLALEAFAGIRYGTAAKITRVDLSFSERGIVLPAASIKTQRREYIDHLPENLWAWLLHSNLQAWEQMTPRQYLQAKSKAFEDAKVPHPRNCLRHSFATYHVAAYRSAAATAVILCHTKPTMLYKHYKGAATHDEGLNYFQILP